MITFTLTPQKKVSNNNVKNVRIKFRPDKRRKNSLNLNTVEFSIAKRA